VVWNGPGAERKLAVPKELAVGYPRHAQIEPSFGYSEEEGIVLVALLPVRLGRVDHDHHDATRENPNATSQ
jgi:hypothetical protein